MVRHSAASRLLKPDPVVWHREIDWTSSQSVGLVNLIVASPWGMQDLCTRIQGTRIASGPPAILTDQSMSQEFDPNSDTQYSFANLQSIYNTGPWSFAWVSMAYSFSVVAAPHIALFVSTPSNTRFGYQNTPYLYIDTAVTRRRWSIPGPVAMLGSEHRGVITHDGFGNYKAWINGFACTPISDGSASTYGGTSSKIGGDTTNRWDGYISEVRRYDRELSDDDVIGFADYRVSQGVFLDLDKSTRFFVWPMRADGVAVSSGLAQIAVSYKLTAVGITVAGGSANLVASVPLIAVGASIISGSAVATAIVSISAAGLAQAAGQAGLFGSILLAGAGAAQASGNAALAGILQLAAAGAAESSGSARLLATLNFTASGGAIASGSADLQSVIAISADGFVEAMGSGRLLINIDLSALGAADALGSAQLLMRDTHVYSSKVITIRVQRNATAFARID